MNSKIIRESLLRYQAWFPKLGFMLDIFIRFYAYALRLIMGMWSVLNLSYNVQGNQK